MTEPASRRLPTPMFNKSAFTIAELIVVTVLLGVIVAAGIAPYVIQQDLLKKQFARSRLQDEVSVAMAYISRDIFRAKAYEIQGGPGAQGLVLTVEPALGAPEQTITYTRDGQTKTINRTIGANTQRIASYIQQFDPSNTGVNFVSVKIRGQMEGQTIILESSWALRARAAA